MRTIRMAVGLSVGLRFRLRIVSRERSRVAERQSAKFNLTYWFRIWRNFGSRIINTRLRRKYVAEPPHRRRAALKNIGDPAQRDHWPNQQRQIGIKRNQSAQ